MQIKAHSTDSLVIDVKKLGKSLDGKIVLEGIDLQIKRGHVIAIIGPSGAGKSTLLRCLNLLHLIDCGEIHAFGQPVITVPECDLRERNNAEQSLPPAAQARIKTGKAKRPVPIIHVKAEEHRRRVGMVFQEFNLWDNRTVLGNITEGPVYARGEKIEKAEAHAIELLTQFGLRELACRRPNELSTGQRQRVALVRAIAMRPAVLLLDEPTSALDPELVADVLAAIRQLALDGMTMVLITHHLRFAKRIANEVIMLDSGKIIERGAPDQILTAPSEQRTRQFIGRLEEAQ